MTSWGMAVVLAPDGPDATGRWQTSGSRQGHGVAGRGGDRAGANFGRLEDPALAKVGFQVAVVLRDRQVCEAESKHDISPRLCCVLVVHNLASRGSLCQ